MFLGFKLFPQLQREVKISPHPNSQILSFQGKLCIVRDMEGSAWCLLRPNNFFAVVWEWIWDKLNHQMTRTITKLQHKSDANELGSVIDTS